MPRSMCCGERCQAMSYVLRAAIQTIQHSANAKHCSCGHDQLRLQLSETAIKGTNLVNTEAEVSGLGEVFSPQLVLLHLETSLKDLHRLLTPHSAVHRDLFVTSHAECTNSVPSQAAHCQNTVPTTKPTVSTQLHAPRRRALTRPCLHRRRTTSAKPQVT